MTKSILGFLGGSGFNTPELPKILLIKALIVQKIIGINRNVPWPVHWTSRIKSPDMMSRGSRFPGLSPGCYFDARNGIKIEENVWIGPGVKIISMNHDVNDYNRYVKSEPIIIRKNCWIGANAILLSGVELGEHTVVAAGAIVTKPFLEGNSVIGGNPAKLIKKIDRYLSAH